ncbi:MAG: hypothetical protein VKP63_05970 [Cyanobacteriota bacterium]|nr:hypothetical protein [Cyanobacteriota bacterium]
MHPTLARLRETSAEGVRLGDRAQGKGLNQSLIVRVYGWLGQGVLACRVALALAFALADAATAARRGGLASGEVAASGAPRLSLPGQRLSLPGEARWDGACRAVGGTPAHRGVKISPSWPITPALPDAARA